MKWYFGSYGPEAVDVRVIEIIHGGIRVTDLQKIYGYGGVEIPEFAWGCFSSAVSHLCAAILKELLAGPAPELLVHKLKVKWASRIPTRAGWMINADHLYTWILANQAHDTLPMHLQGDDHYPDNPDSDAAPW